MMPVPCRRVLAAASRRAVAPVLPARGGARRAATHRAAAAAAEEEEEEAVGHQPPPGVTVENSEEDVELATFRSHQQTAERISFAEEARTLIDLGRTGVLSTISGSKGTEGYPVGAVVGFAADDQGRPVFSFSSMSGHTQDLKHDARCSLTVMAPGFAGAADARVTLTGAATPVPEEEVAACRELYLEKHPEAFWVDFGDFTWHRMEEVLGARLIGGFARAGSVGAQQYFAASPDPVRRFSGPVCGHMNADHGESTTAIVRSVVGVTVDDAQMVTLDRLGMDCTATFRGSEVKMRVPFPRPAEGRKDIKTLIVEMTKAAAAAPAAAEE